MKIEIVIRLETSYVIKNCIKYSASLCIFILKEDRTSVDS